MPKAQLLAPFERVLTLRRIRALAGVEPVTLAELAQQAEERHYGNGELIFSSREPLDRFHVLVRGRAIVTSPESDGEILDAPCPLALLSFLGRLAHQAEAKAIGDVVTLSVDRDAVEEGLADNAAVVQAVVSHLASQAIERLAAILPGAHIAPDREPEDPGLEATWMARIRRLRSSSMFCDGSIEAYMSWARIMEPVELAPGTRLWETGDAADSALILTSGRLRGVGADGLEFMAGPGFQAGILECLCRQPRWFTAIAESPVRGLRIEPRRALDLLEGRREMTLDFISRLARRVLEPTMWHRLGKNGDPARVPEAPAVVEVPADGEEAP